MTITSIGYGDISANTTNYMELCVKSPHPHHGLALTRAAHLHDGAARRVVAMTDPNASPPHPTDAPRWVASTLMMLGALTWAQTIGSFCGVIAALDPDGRAFKNTLDSLNSFMEVQR